ncbi:hypothetical protein ASPZODRAFT_21392 [Penicilliopsis zonata CBS 506.65]|uniref:Uncharacterized protein n=1 Tax=Penicilliopsis zonata CBS 506.65 TaxID=1073090 RepID=A0A1L9SUZ4_9EURO|nr:hypothetical protein ASPZODRAFT_21392 [Penicilliopsis zonata CBS 506.65]OJJ50883.1 hypothetical protein ASPZODRAFT_21392 [Penicilliopsis zonata CBS 506.65]
MTLTRKIYSCNLVTDFLDYLLHDSERETTLVVCSSRERFLEQLYAAIHLSQPDHGAEEPHEQADGDVSSQGFPDISLSKYQRLLTKTIGLLGRSRRVKLVFCQTVETLRAYISVLPVVWAKHAPASGEQQVRQPLLAVLNLLELHRLSSEFSAQGLSRTLATMVEMAASVGSDLLLCECRDATGVSGIDSGQRLWFGNVPILSSAIRIGGDDGAWSGHGVPVIRVVQRWFEFDDHCPALQATTNS